MVKSNLLRVTNVLDKNLKGWLPVVDEKGNKFEIAYSTLLERINEKKFILKEGINKNKIITINYRQIIPRYFKYYFVNNYLNNNIKLVLSLKEQEIYLFFNKSNIRKISVTVQNLEIGNYFILFPQKKFQGKMTDKYISEQEGGSRFAQTWFPIKKNVFEERYIHFGRVSSGCVTIIYGSTDLFNILYLNLMKSRLKEDAIGILKVVKEL